MSSIVAEESSTLPGSPLYRLKHKWTIKDFAATYLADSTDTKSTYPRIYSAWFSSSLDSQVEFRIRLRPRGEDEKSKKILCMSIEMKRSRPSLLAKSADVKYKFSFLNERNEKYDAQEIRQEFKYPSDIRGFDIGLEHSQLQHPANGLLPGDQLTILAEIDVFPEPVIQQDNELLLAKLQVASIENARASLVGLLDNSDHIVHSDVLLVVNRQELPAHKTLLSAHSPAFSAMFKSKVTEVKISNMKLAVAKKLLRFIYTGEVENELEEYGEELLVAADKYGITRLKALCSQFLCGQLNTENAAHLLAFADRHSVSQLKSTSVKFIRTHLEDVCLTQKWNLAQKVFLKELRKLKENEKREKGEKGKTPEKTSIVRMSAIATELQSEESSTVNGSLKYRLKYDWTVHDFASTYLADSTDKASYPELHSTWFSSPLDSQVEYRISLWPRGQDEETQNNLSLFLEMKRSRPSHLTKSADVKFKLSLLNERNEKCHSQECRREFVYPLDNWGDDTFLRHDVLQDPTNGLLPGDQLTILVEIDVFPEPIIKHGNESLLAKLKAASIENVKASLAGILKSGAHSDVTLEVDGSTQLAAHKAILSLHSPVFNAMLKSEMGEQKDGPVKIPDLKAEVAQALLRFIYTGEVVDLAKYAEELLVVADKYDVARLKALCSQYLCAQVNTENAARLLALGDRHSVGQLKSLAFDYIQANLNDVLLTDDWLLVHELFTSEVRQLKAKQGEKRKTPEGSDSGK